MTAETAGRCLIPFDRREAISIAVAAKRAAVSDRTMRDWCERHAIGRRIGGSWRVSQVALAMFLDGDVIALAAYLAGDRNGDAVRQYFQRFNLPSRRPVIVREIGEGPSKAIR